MIVDESAAPRPKRQPRRRGHFMLKSAAGLLRLWAIVMPVVAILLTATLATMMRGFGVAAAFVGPYTVFVVLFMAGYGVVWWGIADALVVIADTADAQDEMRAEISRLAGQRS